MKMTPGQVDALRSVVAPLDSDDRRARYIAGDFPRAELVKDIDMRYRWDLLHEAATPMTITALYDQGCNDKHIDTALRSIVAPLTAEVSA